MASFSSPGVGSGLDVNTMVSQLVAAERAPTANRLSQLESTTKAQISAFGKINSALAGLRDSLGKFAGDGALPGRKVEVQQDAGFTATASARAGIGI